MLKCFFCLISCIHWPSFKSLYKYFIVHVACTMLSIVHIEDTHVYWLGCIEPVTVCLSVLYCKLQKYRLSGYGEIFNWIHRSCDLSHWCHECDLLAIYNILWLALQSSNTINNKADMNRIIGGYRKKGPAPNLTDAIQSVSVIIVNVLSYQDTLILSVTRVLYYSQFSWHNYP